MSLFLQINTKPTPLLQALGFTHTIEISDIKQENMLMDMQEGNKKITPLEIIRWVFALPAALLAALVSFVIMRLLGNFGLSYAFIEPGSFWSMLFETTIASAIMGSVFVYVGGYVVPKHKMVFAFVFGGINILIAGFLIFPAILVEDWWAIAGAISMGVGAASMAWSLLSGEIDFK